MQILQKDQITYHFSQIWKLMMSPDFSIYKLKLTLSESDNS